MMIIDQNPRKKEAPSSSSGQSQQKHGVIDKMLSDFDPFLGESEMVELGLSHEIVNDELYLPSHPSRDWIHCHITTTGPGCFRMYLEGKKRVRFLLSAKQFNIGDSFYISSSEDFPVLDCVPRSGYLARVERQRDDSFLLCLNQCRLCDVNLGFFHCGRTKPEREVIARMYHHYRTFRPTNVEYRCLNVTVPAISKSGKRKIWCPRAFRRANPSLGADIDVNTAISLFRDVSFRFENAKPEWNPKAKSLVVKFQGNRVLIPSTRNFLLCTSWDNCIITANQEPEDDDDEHGELDEDFEEEYWEDGTKSVGTRSIHENDIVPMNNSKSSHDEHDDSHSISSGSSNTVATQPILTTGSPLPYSGAGRKGQSSLSPPTSSFSSPTKATLMRAQTMPYPPSVSAANTPIKPSQSMTYPVIRVRSESSVDSESTVSANSMTPSKISMRSAFTHSSTKSIRVGSPKPHGSPSITSSQTPKKKMSSKKKSKIIEDNEPVLQFGKTTHTKYSLDFKFPLSPLQAFGIALSAFAFESMNQCKQMEKQSRTKK